MNSALLPSVIAIVAAHSDSSTALKPLHFHTKDELWLKSSQNSILSKQHYFQTPHVGTACTKQPDQLSLVMLGDVE